ncbi:hypothetical protein FE257_010282 [Aspergillus nanangensis]|uniref:HDA1 complex subunit n=1 Tax=Aspergillus nanangensis TaxID=2582783 RepID=A0AAD4CJ87_ASPNN|nr:hypothetical protein FE257_010282 [Aspergillus nanangensis]
MARKRKALSQVYTPTTNALKKRKAQNFIVISSGDEDEDEDEDDNSTLAEDEYLIKCILDESESQYLIDWEGSWTPSWEPKEHANETAIQTWELKKEVRAASEPPVLEGPCATHLASDTRNRMQSVPESAAAETTQPSILSTSRKDSLCFENMEEHSHEKLMPASTDTLGKYNDSEEFTSREKIKNVYSNFQATASSSAIPNEPSATPSSMGDIEASAPISLPETAAPLSVRVDRDTTHHTHAETSVPQDPVQESSEPSGVQIIQPSALTVTEKEAEIPGSVYLGPAEFAVPLPMDSRVKDDYERVLANEAQNIWGVLNQSQPSDELSAKLSEVFHTLSNVATHPDLNISEHIKDSSSDLAKEAAWAEYSSAKFLFLGYLVEFASSRDTHFIIMVHGGKTQKIVERYLLGKGLTYTREREEIGFGSNLEISMVKGSLSFGIQSTSTDGIQETFKAPSAIIALDSSFNATTPPVEHMRTTFARHGNLLPVIRLLVSNSSEHVELCFPGFSGHQRLRLITQYTLQLRDIVGDLQDDAFGVREDVEEILLYLFSENFNVHWPLPLIEPLRILSDEELDSIQTRGDTQPSAESAPLSEHSNQKRQFEEETEEQISKRPRVDLFQDPSQFTQSTKFPSQTLDNDLQALEKHLVQMRTTHAAELEKLQQALSDAQSCLRDRETILSSLQHRYETRTKDLHKIRQERDRLADSKSASEQRIEKQKDDISKLKDERTRLRHELEGAREELKAGGGNAAELEAVREEVRRLSKETASLERKAEYESRQAEYTREQYQTASNVAAQSGNEVRQLREENETLKRKVAIDTSRLREINIKNDEARHLARVAELETALSSRDDLLRKKEDELREIRKNRPSTRSTSTQPRSPKWNAANSRPTSPGFGNNGSSHPGRGSALRFSSEMSL